MVSSVQFYFEYISYKLLAPCLSLNIEFSPFQQFYFDFPNIVEWPPYLLFSFFFRFLAGNIEQVRVEIINLFTASGSDV